MLKLHLKLRHTPKINFNSRFTHEWSSPEGHDTGIKINSRLVNKKVPLIIPNKHFVKWYMCGPTVYDSSHIGHASCYVRFDIIRRILIKYFDIHPIIALGITDIDDKIIKRAIRYKEDFRAIAKRYELEFLKELGDLNVLPPTFVTRVTDHVPDIIDFIGKIIERGQGYQIDDGSVYFDNSLKSYGHFVDISGDPEVKLRKGQKHQSDFALWKAVKPDEPFWESPWGKGRPGWHIECSTMASKLFGPVLDFHSGGIDLMFPHHQNEEAQSCSYHGHNQWVNYWIHAGEMKIGEEKMSKSLQNSVLISELLNEHTSDHFRMFCFRTNYNDALHYSKEAFRHTAGDCDKVKNFLADADSYVKGNWLFGDVSESILLQELELTAKSIKENLADDFQTAKCFISLQKLVNLTVAMMNEKKEASTGRSPAAIAAVSNFIGETFDSFGFQFRSKETAKSNESLLEQILDSTISFRNQVRQTALSVNEKPAKQNLLKACDTVRDDLKTFGITIKDQSSSKSSWAFLTKT